MFREDNQSYYRPSNTNTNHAIHITRMPKKKDMIENLKNEIASLRYHMKIIGKRIHTSKERPNDLTKYQMLKQKVWKLQRQMDDIQNQTIVHKPIKTKKKVNNEIIFAACLQAIKDSISANISFLTAEDVAYQIQTQVYAVKQAFEKLNKMGLLSQPVHQKPHDCYRGYDHPEYNDSGWAGDIYYVTEKARNQFRKEVSTT